jgi:hypothetical protein
MRIRFVQLSQRDHIGSDPTEADDFKNMHRKRVTEAHHDPQMNSDPNL